LGLRATVAKKGKDSILNGIQSLIIGLFLGTVIANATLTNQKDFKKFKFFLTDIYHCKKHIIKALISQSF